MLKENLVSKDNVIQECITFCKRMDTSNDSEPNQLLIMHILANVSAILCYKFDIGNTESILKIVNSDTFENITNTEKDEWKQSFDSIIRMFGREFSINNIESIDCYSYDFMIAYTTFDAILGMNTLCNIDIKQLIDMCNNRGVVELLVVGYELYHCTGVLSILDDINSKLQLGLNMPKYIGENRKPVYKDGGHQDSMTSSKQ